jgi:chemotaxis protein MotB
MQAEGVRSDQISQVRGFADQRLRLPKQPEDPSNRRISLIVQYLVNNDAEVAPPDALTRLGMATPAGRGPAEPNSTGPSATAPSATAPNTATPTTAAPSSTKSK